MKKAIIEKGKVVQVVDNEFKAANNVTFVDCDATILSGDLYENGKFVKEYKAQRPLESKFKQAYVDSKTGKLVYFDGFEVKTITGEQLKSAPKAKGVKKDGK